MRILPVLLLLTAAAWAQQKATIEGSVVDKDGKPVAGASVATMWGEGRPFGGTTSDGGGSFSCEVDDYGRPVAILVMNKERTHGVVSRFSRKSFGKPRKLTLEPLVRVHGKFYCKALKSKPSWTNVYVNAVPGRIRVARHSSDAAEFSFLLPPGEYQLYMYGTDTQKVIRDEFFIDGDEKEVDLKTVNLPATNLAKMYGKKPAKLKVTGARGAKQNVKLSDYKGKWVIVEFWGFW